MAGWGWEQECGLESQPCLCPKPWSSGLSDRVGVRKAFLGGLMSGAAAQFVQHPFCREGFSAKTPDRSACAQSHTEFMAVKAYGSCFQGQSPIPIPPRGWDVGTALPRAQSSTVHL